MKLAAHDEDQRGPAFKKNNGDRVWDMKLAVYAEDTGPGY
jgi:hypothetical protein